MKKILFILSLIALSSFSYGLLQTESVGGTATSMGGIILDADLGGLNALYNPTQIVFQDLNTTSLDISATGAANPYGVTGINNAAFGLTFFKPNSGMNLGIGLGAHLNMVDGGINQNRFFVSGALSFKDMVKNISFISGFGASLTAKIINFGLGGVTVENIDTSSATSVNLDVDVSLRLFKDKLTIGVMGADLLPLSISFLGASNLSDIMGLFIHAKIAMSESLSFFGVYNPLGAAHLVDRDNFFSSSTAFMNMYFGLEGNFADSLFVRIGVKEGRLTGGLGIKVQDLDINVGIMPINAFGLYYQVDLNYKLDFGSKSSVKKVNSDVKTETLEMDDETESVVVE